MADVSELIRQRAEERETWTEARRVERDELSQKRDSILEEMTGTPDLYAQYLNLQGDNLQCSVGNVALSIAQLKSPTRIGSLNYWHDQGRSVKDEEMRSGAKVFLPPRNKKYHGYIIGDYYDISQTTGRPFPEPPKLAGNDKRMEDALAALIRVSPVPVVADEEMNTPVYYDQEHLELAINPAYNDTEIFAAMAAELTHANFHDRGRARGYERSYCALEADSVAYMLCRRYGVPCRTPDLEEVGRHFEGFTPTDRGDALDLLRKTARDLSTGIDRAIQPRQQERSRRNAYSR